jgi:hypothetical protein
MTIGVRLSPRGEAGAIHAEVHAEHGFAMTLRHDSAG